MGVHWKGVKSVHSKKTWNFSLRSSMIAAAAAAAAAVGVVLAVSGDCVVEGLVLDGVVLVVVDAVFIVVVVVVQVQLTPSVSQ